MFNKKIILILTIILVSLFVISAVSAADNATDNVVSVDDNYISNMENKQILEQSNIDELISEKDNGTFTDLQNKINDAGEGSIINLENDYNYDDNFDIYGISISKPITINGNGHTINANSQSRIFRISSSDVIIKNITFINGKATGVGGAIYNQDYNNFTVTFCNFTNCSAEFAEAIYNAYVDNCNITFCNFIDCSKQWEAIYNLGNNYIIDSCTFTNSPILKSAIRNFGNNYTIISCTFTNHYDTIYNKGNNYTINSCTFTNCSGQNINFGNNYTITSCTFTNCSGENIHNIGNNYTITSCTFTDCISPIENDRVTDCIINYCTFTNCKNEEGGAINNYYVTNCTINYCTFTNCNATLTGGAISNPKGIGIKINYCTFTDCNANTGGAISDGRYRYNDSYILIRGANHSIDSCNFTNCQAKYGGAIDAYSDNNTIIYCIFTNCSKQTIFNLKDNLTITYSSFINCQPTGWDITISNYGDNFIINCCNFTNNENKYDRSVSISHSGNNFTINSSIFTNCTEPISAHTTCFINYCTFSDCNEGISNANLNFCTFTNCILGIRNFDNSFSINYSTFTNCSGSAIYNYNCTNSTINYCTFINCNGSMGVINNDFSDNVAVKYCTFINCQANVDRPGWDGEKCGGAIHNIYSNNNDIYSCNFTNCSADDCGGAIYCVGESYSIKSCIFTNCKSNNDGGAIFNEFNYCVVDSCTFTDCQAKNEGGAIKCDVERGVTIKYSNLTNCNARYGGAILCYGLNGCTINSCNFKHCQATKHGGAIYVIAKKFSSIKNKFIGNTAEKYPNVYNNTPSTKLTIKNSIKEYNTQPSKLTSMSQLNPVTCVFTNNDKISVGCCDLEYEIYKGKKLLFSTFLCIKNGKVSLQPWVIDSDVYLPALGVGKYDVVVRTSGGSFYQAPAKTATLSIIGKTTLKAPKVTNKYKKSQYFKATIKLKGKAVKKVKINLKIYTGKKYKNYAITTDNNGIAKFNTKSLSIGKHKVVITSKNSCYVIKGNSQITIKR